MTAATAARRLPVLAIVAAAHALALALLFELTRTHRLGAVVEESLTLVDLAPAVRPRPRTFGMPSPSAMFDPGPARRRGFAWNHAHTHRVEALPGGVTVFNLNDHCAIALIWIVPAFGCSIGKMPVRSDLFEHMRDLKGRKEPDWP